MLLLNCLYVVFVALYSTVVPITSSALTRSNFSWPKKYSVLYLMSPVFTPGPLCEIHCLSSPTASNTPISSDIICNIIFRRKPWWLSRTNQLSTLWLQKSFLITQFSELIKHLVNIHIHSPEHFASLLCRPDLDVAVGILFT